MELNFRGSIQSAKNAKILRIENLALYGTHTKLHKLHCPHPDNHEFYKNYNCIAASIYVHAEGQVFAECQVFADANLIIYILNPIKK